MTDHVCRGGGTARTLPCPDPACAKSPRYARWTVLDLELERVSTYVRVWTGWAWAWLLAKREAFIP